MRIPPHRPVAATALVLLLVGTGAAVSSAAPTNPTAVDCLPVLEEPAAGSEAVAALGADLPAVARANGRSAAELRHTLGLDESLTVSTCGQLFYVDTDWQEHAHNDGDAAADELVFTPWTLWSEWVPTEALAAVGGIDVTTLHSNRGAQRVLHLDFDGAQVLPGWERDFVQETFPPFDVNDDPTTLSDIERAAVYEIWSRVVEDYAPWDVDVTTELPSTADLLISGPDDERFGVSTVITQNGPRASGIAWLGKFGVETYAEQGGFTFVGTGDSRVSPQQIATIVSHELGHNLRLDHHGLIVKGGSTYEYNPGNPAWTPIMGNGGAAMSQWNDGRYPGATNPDQSDVPIIGQTLPVATDPNATATRLRVGTPAKGVIRSTEEVDTWTVTAGARIRVEVSSARFGPNLDPRLTVLNQSGVQVLGVYDPPLVQQPASQRPSRLDIDQVLELPGGSYTLVVEGVSGGTPELDSSYLLGYPDYGSLGRYTIKVSRACGSTGVPSVCRPVKN